LTGGRVKRYGQEQDRTEFVSNVTTVCFSGYKGEHTRPFRSQRNDPAAGHRPKDYWYGKTVA
jgi:hypothetical protein